MGVAAKVAAEPKRQDQRQVHERISNELGKSRRLEACERAQPCRMYMVTYWNQKQT